MLRQGLIEAGNRNRMQQKKKKDIFVPLYLNQGRNDG
jgi:hypothetical protein